MQQNTIRIPPHSDEAEKSVLGGILIEKDAMINVADIIKPDDFYVYGHQLIFAAMLTLYDRQVPIDLLTVAEELKNTKQLKTVGGKTYIAELTAYVAMTSHLVEYAMIIKTKSTLRKLITAGSKIAQLGFQEDQAIEQLLDEAEKSVVSVRSGQNQKIKNSQNLSDEYMEAYHEAKRLETLGKSEFLRTGFKKIDQNITLMRGHVTVLMARSSIGKSALALNLAMGAVENDARVLFITLEMNENEVMNRVLSYISEESNTRFKYRSIDPTPHVDFFSQHYHNLHIIAPSNCDINKLTAIMCAEKYDMVVIDYLGYLAFPNTKNRNEAIGDVTRRIKEIAKQQQCHVLLLSQVRRGADRKNTVPDLEDLRDSGNIEQDADEVIALNRESRDSTDAILVVRKGRTGVAELAIPLTYQPHLTKFEEQASIGNMWSA